MCRSPNHRANLRGATTAAPAPSIQPPYGGQIRPNYLTDLYSIWFKMAPIPKASGLGAPGKIQSFGWPMAPTLSNGLVKKDPCTGQLLRNLGISLLPGPPRRFRLWLGS